MVRKWPLQKLTWAEASGAVGDLGTFLPLLIALAVHNGLDIGTTLLFTGVYNIFTGTTWTTPLRSDAYFHPLYGSVRQPLLL